jgi:hypothetical protein
MRSAAISPGIVNRIASLPATAASPDGGCNRVAAACTRAINRAAATPALIASTPGHAIIRRCEHSPLAKGRSEQPGVQSGPTGKNTRPKRHIYCWGLRYCFLHRNFGGVANAAARREHLVHDRRRGIRRAGGAVTRSHLRTALTPALNASRLKNPAPTCTPPPGSAASCPECCGSARRTSARRRR